MLSWLKHRKIFIPMDFSTRNELSNFTAGTFTFSDPNNLGSCVRPCPWGGGGLWWGYDGTHRYLQLPPTAWNVFPPWPSAIGLSFCLTDYSAGRDLFGKGNPDAGGYMCLGLQTTSSGLTLWIKDNARQIATAVKPGLPYRVLLSMPNNNTFEVYLNGRLIFSSSGVYSSGIYAVPTRIGHLSDLWYHGSPPGEAGKPGMLWDFALYGQALTQAQALEEYYAALLRFNPLRMLQAGLLGAGRRHFFFGRHAGGYNA